MDTLRRNKAVCEVDVEAHSLHMDVLLPVFGMLRLGRLHHRAGTAGTVNELNTLRASKPQTSARTHRIAENRRDKCVLHTVVHDPAALA